MVASLLHQVPNIISAGRLVCCPILIGLAYGGYQKTFAWLLLAAFISDAVDGLIARTAGITSKRGAFLDSVADLSIQVAAMYGVWAFYEPFVRANVAIFALVLGLWACDVGFAYWRYGRVASFHTYTSRIGAYALATFLVVLFLWGVHMWLFYFVVAIIVLSLVEGLILMSLIPRWTSDVQGLYWVLKARHKDS